MKFTTKISARDFIFSAYDTKQRNHRIKLELGIYSIMVTPTDKYTVKLGYSKSLWIIEFT